MTYFLGVDLGTTYTAAAIHRDGRTSTVDLGTRTAAVPSVVFLREDDTVLTGEAASRRGATEPSRIAREFKRRFGDTTPILLGGSPYSADALMSKLLRWVVDAVTEREGSPPAGIAVTYPANWGPYKQELLHQAIVRADLDHVATISEPEAAVTYYSSQERIEPGSVIAVYDLGGGTFDAAVVRKTEGGVELLGTPEGIERLGGIDFDDAVFSHVRSALGGVLEQLDPNDPTAMAAVARLRRECVDAKEALSADTETSIPVLLPNVSTDVRLTRAEFEAMIRPPLADSLTALRRAVRSAGVEPDDLRAVLLAGGSSRIPLVAQLVSAELGRPVAVDAHPKHGVALGAAQAAAAAAGHAAPGPNGASNGSADDGGQDAAAAGLAAAAGATAVLGATAAASPPPSAPSPSPPPDPLLAPVGAADAPAAGPTVPGDPTTVGAGGADPPALARLSSLEPPEEHNHARFASDTDGGRGRGWWLALAAAALVAGGVIAFLLLSGGDDDDGTVTAGTTGATADVDDGGGDPTVAPTDAPDVTEAPATSTAEVVVTDPPESTAPPVCPPGDTRLCIEITNVVFFDDALVVDWTPFNFEPATDGFHAHFFWNTTRPEEAGTNAGAFGATPGEWELTDDRPFVSQNVLLRSAKPPDATEVCVTPATHEHAVVDPTVFQCVPLPE